MKLWTINKWLRWTGWRLFVIADSDPESETQLCVNWVGLYGSLRWQKWEPGTPHWREWL